ncbi:hypothetical protein N7510_006119 [Penicillium lagena]|uniref:uncharacterized protein n=1 Tax=Penicillium lagena TaxID=94218 RepID=UPI00254140E3|nr:uncharacterized protein N7510_006119 [Penicillium lagena]KAJ5612925.1 hypothetical protein N7510_006119 [Penicillium lagena]
MGSTASSIFCPCCLFFSPLPLAVTEAPLSFSGPLPDHSPACPATPYEEVGPPVRPRLRHARSPRTTRYVRVRARCADAWKGFSLPIREVSPLPSPVSSPEPSVSCSFPGSPPSPSNCFFPIVSPSPAPTPSLFPIPALLFALPPLPLPVSRSVSRSVAPSFATVDERIAAIARGEKTAARWANIGPLKIGPPLRPRKRVTFGDVTVAVVSRWIIREEHVHSFPRWSTPDPIPVAPSLVPHHETGGPSPAKHDDVDLFLTNPISEEERPVSRGNRNLARTYGGVAHSTTLNDNVLVSWSAKTNQDGGGAVHETTM